MQLLTSGFLYSAISTAPPRLPATLATSKWKRLSRTLLLVSKYRYIIYTLGLLSIGLFAVRHLCLLVKLSTYALSNGHESGTLGYLEGDTVGKYDLKTLGELLLELCDNTRLRLGKFFPEWQIKKLQTRFEFFVGRRWVKQQPHHYKPSYICMNTDYHSIISCYSCWCSSQAWYDP
jgi:hypothetical protein